MRILWTSATRNNSGPLPPPVPLPALISAPTSVSRVTMPSNGAAIFLKLVKVCRRSTSPWSAATSALAELNRALALL
jgi:hypothetical protein